MDNQPAPSNESFEEKKYQTRSDASGECDVKFFDTLEEAQAAAAKDPSIWKISWTDDGKRIRTVKMADGSWKEESIDLDQPRPN